jgi:fatty-acyl-CoA synthase
MLLAHPALDATDLSSLQCLWYGAAPISADRLEEAITRIGPVMGQLFGQSEAPMMVSTLAPADHLRPDGSIARERLSSAGRPTPLVTVAIMSPDGELLPAGERGEVVVRGSLVMAGYHKDPEATAEASRFGWHHTGDIGYLDEENFLYLVDRAKDMIISGGFNVYSAEVERALMAHPGVQDCAVIGLPDEKWGETVCAVIEANAGAIVVEHELIEYCTQRLAGYKKPTSIRVVDELPRTAGGKPKKFLLRERFASVGESVMPS